MADYSFVKQSYFRLEVWQSSPMVEQIDGSSKYLSGSYTTIPIRGPSYDLVLSNGIHCDSSDFRYSLPCRNLLCEPRKTSGEDPGSHPSVLKA